MKPFYSDKYDITKHKRYKYLSDYDEKNTFDLERYISREATINENDIFEAYVAT